MEVATSLIWFCWAGTMESEGGWGVGVGGGCSGLLRGKYITIHGEREKGAAE